MSDSNENFYRKNLSEDEYHCLREQGTEKPFSGTYYDFFEEGIYLCKACKSPLFSSQHKFSSMCGWPSFSDTIKPDVLTVREDFSHNMQRKEILCSKCLSHHGHVFDDGPKPNKLRYCVNSVGLIFQPQNH